MEVFYPEYYQHFRCLAGACPDSCCKEWDIDVDPQSARMYRALPGALGERLRQVLQDTEDGTVMVITDGRCPMWQQDGLCRIQATLGHDALCDVCREFPRLHHDYGSFSELGLELSCPEAARLILSDTDGILLSRTQDGESAPDYDVEVMSLLRSSRATILSYIHTTNHTPSQILTSILLYAEALQFQMDGGEPACFCPAEYVLTDNGQAGNLNAVFRFFQSLEILTPQWKQLLTNPAPRPLPDTVKALVRYFIQRYWYQAVSDYDILGRACFCVIACLMICSVELSFSQAAQLFSKEIENSTENVNAILDGIYTNDWLSCQHILNLLQDF